ncbi:MAG: hypothetical protein COS68_01355 [Elusimicrobia bacterium CG06_land_8_20_14_3_00_38_11]|nr:MAG: hypothetical protein COS68_01355 [Elusimicrobia bacterium CG06_land_8_20_14_3_00_38_11]
MKPLTTYQISQMVNADISTVIDWIDKGLLKAYKTPGGHRRIKWNDLVEFLKKYEMPIPDNVAVGLLSNEKTANGNSPATKKILIVDDNEDILEFISRAIKKFYKKIKIETITEGFIAGKRIAEFKPDLLILDIRLPGMNGFEVLEHLDKSEKDMKILAITAYSSKEIKEKIIKAGADDYLIKPFTVEQLKGKIEKLVE